MEGTRIPILGGLGGLRSGGEKLGSGQGHIGSLPYWWLQSTGKIGWERREACVCVQVSVFGCVWLRLISSSWGSLTGSILDPVTLSCVVRSSDCLPVSWSVVFVRSCFLLPWFLISAVSWTLNTGHLAAHCFPELPAPTYGELNLVSSVSPVWRVCNKPFLFPQLESSSLYSYSCQVFSNLIRHYRRTFRAVKLANGGFKKYWIKGCR